MSDEITPIHLNGTAALIAAGRTSMCKRKGEYDTEFVKRIVCAYMNAHMELQSPTPGESK